MLEDKKYGDIEYYIILYKKMIDISYELVLIILMFRRFIELKEFNMYIFYDIKVLVVIYVGSGLVSDFIKVCID